MEGKKADPKHTFIQTGWRVPLEALLHRLEVSHPSIRPPQSTAGHGTTWLQRHLGFLYDVIIRNTAIGMQESHYLGFLTSAFLAGSCKKGYHLGFLYDVII